MRFVIDNVKMGVKFSLENVAEKISEMLNIPKNEITKMKILHKSLDARRKDRLTYVLSCSFEATENIEKSLSKLVKVEQIREYSLFDGLKLNETKNIDNKNSIGVGAIAEIDRPIIIGSGPAGLFCAIVLAEYGMRPIIIEQGENVTKRAFSIDNFWKGGGLNTHSNVQFGEGGAGTFSDGKLNTGIGNTLCYYVLEQFVKFGAPESILYEAKPHVGTDILIKVVAKIREHIVELGGEYRFETKMTDIKVKNGEIVGIVCQNGANTVEMDVRKLVLAVGHSSRETFHMLDRHGIKMENKPFAVGLRIEHLQSEIDKSQYGDSREKLGLPPSDYKLAVNLENGRGVYTFCMCPGGQIVAATSEDGGITVNGMSYSTRDGKNSNSAVICTVKPSDFEDKLFSGMEFQQQLERAAYDMSNSYKAPCQRLEDFVKSRESVDFSTVQPTYLPSVVKGDINKILPKFIGDSIKQALPIFGKKIKGFDNPDALLTGVETRTSCPIRILRNVNGECNVFGIFPTGEGGGYSGGITSSAVDGIKTAVNIIKSQNMTMKS